MRIQALPVSAAALCLIAAATPSQANAVSPSPSVPSMVSTPVGPQPTACVHQVAPHTTVHHGQTSDTVVAPDGTRQEIARCRTATDRGITGEEQPVFRDGWQASARYGTSRRVAYMHATFTVPQTPRAGYTGQIDYLFPALTPQDNRSIIQPVLDYGAFGPSWQLAAWAGVNGDFVHTDPITVRPGDVIYTSMFRGCDVTGCFWTLAVTDRTTRTSTDMRTDADLDWQVIYPGALETYGVTQCNQLPASSTTISDIWVADSNGREITAPTYSESNDDTLPCHPRATQHARTRSVTLSNDPA